MEILVSICIPTYNGSRWLRTCIESALSCTANCEIIVVDDGSTDETVLLAKELAAKDSRVKVFVNAKNIGLVGNWNRCLELASGEWIKFLFQDDALGKNAIEEMLKAAGKSGQLVAAKRNFIFNEQTSETSKKYYSETVLTIEKLFSGENNIEPTRLVSEAAKHPTINFIGEPSTMLFRRSLIKEFGGFDNSLRQLCDLEFWLRIGGRLGIHYAPNASVDFLVHNESVSAQNTSERKFVSTYLDPVRVVDLQLNSNLYNDFRKHLSPKENKRLSLWLRLRCYEAKINAKTAEEKLELNKLFAQKTHLQKLANKTGNRILFGMLKMRRKS
jgi:glycosyltransferase involved in cell wall biosynthesis